MSNNNKTPAIRFKGFTDTWEQRELSDEFERFIVPMRDKPKQFGGNIPWTRIEDIEGKYLNDSLSGQYVTDETVKQMNLKIIPKDSLIVSSSATFGVVAVVTQDLITNQTFIGLVPNDNETLDYWYAFFYSNGARRYMKSESAGSTIFYIARESFEKMPIKIPLKSEMLKIGAYFDTIDHLITLHQRKCDKLIQFKAAMLQKMFPQNDADKPEIRFKGFTDAWEQRKLGDMCDEFQSGKSIKASDITDSGEYAVYGGNGFRGYTDTYNHDGDYALIGRQGALCGNMNFSSGKAYFTEHAVAVHGNADNDTLFLYYLLNLMNLGQYSGQSAQPGLAVNKIIQLKTKAPKLDEQRLISSFFKQLDSLITLHQRKCEKYKSIKAGLIRKLFP